MFLSINKKLYDKFAVHKVEAWSFWCDKKFFLNLSIEWSSANDILLLCTFWINLDQTLLRWWKFFKVIPNFFSPWTLSVQNWRLKNCTFDAAVLLYLVMNRSFLAVGGNGCCFQRFKITRGTPFKIIFSFCNVQAVIQGVTNACIDQIQKNSDILKMLNTTAQPKFWIFWNFSKFKERKVNFRKQRLFPATGFKQG